MLATALCHIDLALARYALELRYAWQGHNVYPSMCAAVPGPRDILHTICRSNRHAVWLLHVATEHRDHVRRAAHCVYETTGRCISSNLVRSGACTVRATLQDPTKIRIFSGGVAA